jgi:hypothetical protein
MRRYAKNSSLTPLDSGLRRNDELYVPRVFMALR